MLTGLFKNARFGPLPNLHTCISLVEVCRFGQCLGWRITPIYFVFLSCIFARLEMRHTRDFGVVISNYVFTGFFKAARFGPFSNLQPCISLVQVNLDNAWVKDSRPFISFFHSRIFARLAMRRTRDFGVGNPNYAYGALLKC